MFTQWSSNEEFTIIEIYNTKAIIETFTKLNLSLKDYSVLSQWEGTAAFSVFVLCHFRCSWLQQCAPRPEKL